MWARLLFALRSRSLDIGAQLGSWKLSVALMTLAALYYTFLAIWAGSSPPQVVQNIASLLPYWLVYGLLLVNTGVCLWRRLAQLRRQVSARPNLTQGNPTWERGTPPEVGPSEAQGLLWGMGYRARRQQDGSVWGVRRRWSALGTYLFHGAFFLVAAGFLATLLTRHEASVWVAAGERFTGDPDQFRSQSAPRILSAGLPRARFEVESITPEFWRDQLLFTKLEARLKLPGGKSVTTRINRPLWWGVSSFLRLSGFGYAALYELTDSKGQLLDRAFVKLNVFPPGQRDSFKVPGFPHRFYVEVLPDFAAVEGEAVTRSLNLTNPAVRLEVIRGRLEVGEAVLPAGRALAFDGLRIRFPAIRHWGEFAIVRDPGAPVVFVGYLLGLTGLLLKLSGARTEVSWQPGSDGTGRLRGWGGEGGGRA